MSSSFAMRRRRALQSAALALALGASALGVWAQAGAYPNRPIRLVVGFAPGGGSDLIGRLVAQRLTDKLGQPVTVENKPGGGGNLAADLALKAPADGYTLFLAAASYTVNPALYRLSFDPLRDMTPIVQLARGPFIIAVHPSVKVAHLKELVEQARKKPDAVSYASSGNGGMVHLVTEYFLDSAGVDMVHIPYKGTSPALADTVGGQAQVIFGTVASTLPFVRSGQLKALAVTSARRLPALPQVPTTAEAGFPGFEATNWHGIIGPKGLPPEVVGRLNKAVNEVLTSPEVEAQLAQDGLTTAGGSAADFGHLLRNEVVRWAGVVKSKNIKLD